MSRKKSAGVFTRLLSMARRDPAIVPAYLRLEYRRRWGGPRDRRLHPAGGSILPAQVSINPTRRCNLACRMCCQFRREDEVPRDLHWYEAEAELPLEAWVKLLDEMSCWRLAQPGPNWPPLPPWGRLMGKVGSARPGLLTTWSADRVHPGEPENTRG